MSRIRISLFLRAGFATLTHVLFDDAGSESDSSEPTTIMEGRGGKGGGHHHRKVTRGSLLVSGVSWFKS